MKQSTPFSRRHGLRGQSVVLMTLVVSLIMVLAFGTSMALFNQQSSQRNIVNKRALQSYYVAMQGVQESLATRMIPRSNQLNFRGITTAGNGLNPGNFWVRPFYPLSGRVFETPVGGEAFNLNTGVYQHGSLTNPQAPNLMGVYRYMIVGGDASISGSNFNQFGPTPGSGLYLTELNHLPGTSPFYIISSGITCINRGGVAVPNALTIQEYPNRPTCRGANVILDETVIVARTLVDEPRMRSATEVDEMGNLWPDRLLSMAAFRNPQPVPNSNFESVSINLNQQGVQNPGAFVPGIGWVANNQQFFFENVWRNRGNQANYPTQVRGIAFYNSATKGIICTTLGVGPACGISNPRIPPNATIRVVFNGPVDFRSFYNYNIQRCVETNPGDPGSGPLACNIQLRDQGNNVKQFNFSWLPPGSNSVVISPSFSPGQRHTLRIQNLHGYNGDTAVPAAWQFQFTAQ